MVVILLRVLILFFLRRWVEEEAGLDAEGATVRPLHQTFRLQIPEVFMALGEIS